VVANAADAGKFEYAASAAVNRREMTVNMVPGREACDALDSDGLDPFVDGGSATRHTGATDG